MTVKTHNIYCYVDESGQDPASPDFIAIAIVIPRDIKGTYQQQLLAIERSVPTHGLKWHKTKRERRFEYLTAVMDQNVAKEETFIGYFQKPTPYFFPIIDTIEKAIKQVSVHHPQYKATVYLDGVDAQKAAQLTNALRSHDIRLRHVRTARDESEPLIRLADMWAGCARAASLGDTEAETLITTAYDQRHLIIVIPKRPR